VVFENSLHLQKASKAGKLQDLIEWEVFVFPMGSSWCHKRYTNTIIIIIIIIIILTRSSNSSVKHSKNHDHDQLKRVVVVRIPRGLEGHQFYHGIAIYPSIPPNDTADI